MDNTEPDSIEREREDYTKHEAGVGAISGAIAGYQIAKTITPTVSGIGPIPKIAAQTAVYCGVIPPMAYAGKKVAETVVSALAPHYLR